MLEVLPWHALPARDVVTSLDSSLRGLSEDKARRRRADRSREPVQAPRRAVLRLFLSQFGSPFVAILLVAVVVNAAFGEWMNALATLAVIWLNAALGFIQEYKADRAFAALQSYVPTVVSVVREGQVRRVPLEEVVTGDVMVLAAGDRVAVDARVLSVNAFAVDESALTGESSAVYKSPHAVRQDAVVAERSSMVYAGSAVTQGQARAVVTAVGTATEFGKITSLATMTVRGATPLQQEVRRLATTIAQIVVSIVPLVFVIGVFRDIPFGDLLITAAALAVASVPEGLLIALTVILTVATRRMLARKVLVRKLDAVEVLGGIHVLCVDKTGTLTEGKMRVTLMFDGIHPVEIHEGLRQRLGHALALMTKPLEGEIEGRVSMTESAIALCAKDVAVHDVAHIATLPFSSEYKFSAKLVSIAGLARVFALGAPEVLLERADLTDAELRAHRGLIADLASKGLRVLAIADGEASGEGALTAAAVVDLRILGFVGIEDPLRDSVAPAVRQAADAGVRTIMITGDNPETALAIAREAGIGREGAVVTGAELATMDEQALLEAVDCAEVFARVLPEQKLMIVRALQRHGLRVAMTGDGVNDAPALRAADVGIAVGHATDVARQSADIVLLESDFARIVDAIREGRVLYENIRKVTAFLVTLSLSSIVLVMSALAFGYTLPLTPFAILWINIVTDGIPAFSLAFEPGEPGVMRERPRNPFAPILHRPARFFMFGTAFIAAAVIIGSMALLTHREVPWEGMQVFFYVLIGGGGLAFLYVARTFYRPFWAVRPLSNPWLTVAFMAGLTLLVLPLQWGNLRSLLGIGTFPWALGGILLACILIEFGCAELLKAVGFRRREIRSSLVS